ncbi:MAG: hypothetical protein K0Q72_3401 [Armatimonadetes bacterium]|nr:hypothetical protein [Armatimonadota bacterium]
MIKLLLAHGADPLSTNAGGKTPREAAQARLDFLTGPNAMPARGEVARIRAAVELLTAAERGEGDLSDIDELAEVSWQAWSAEQEQRRAALKAESPETWRALHGDDA